MKPQNQYSCIVKVGQQALSFFAEGAVAKQHFLYTDALLYGSTI